MTRAIRQSAANSDERRGHPNRPSESSDTELIHNGHLSDADLLGKLIGIRESRRLYRGTLQPLFSALSEAGPSHEKCVVARELGRRWLSEELKSGDVLTSPR